MAAIFLTDAVQLRQSAINKTGYYQENGFRQRQKWPKKLHLINIPWIVQKK